MRTMFALKRENIGGDWSKLLNQGIGGFLGDKDGWYLRLTTLSPSCADCFEIWATQPPGTI
jgi:hypothetical protein